jgi:hypothetical protein
MNPTNFARLFSNSIRVASEPIANAGPLSREQEKAIFAKSGDGGFSGRARGGGSQQRIDRARQTRADELAFLRRQGQMSAETDITPFDLMLASGLDEGLQAILAKMTDNTGGLTQAGLGLLAAGLIVAGVKSGKAEKLARRIDAKKNLREIFEQMASDAARFTDDFADDVPETVGKRLQPTLSHLDIERRFSDGDNLYYFHDMDEKFMPVRSLDDIKNYAPDSVYFDPSPASAPLKSSASVPPVRGTYDLDEIYRRAGDGAYRGPNDVYRQAAEFGKNFTVSTGRPPNESEMRAFLKSLQGNVNPSSASRTGIDQEIFDFERRWNENNFLRDNGYTDRRPRAWDPEYDNRSSRIADHTIANAGNMTDQQRKAMFARRGGGGSRAPSRAGGALPSAPVTIPTQRELAIQQLALQLHGSASYSPNSRAYQEALAEATRVYDEAAAFNQQQYTNMPPVVPRGNTVAHQWGQNSGQAHHNPDGSPNWDPNGYWVTPRGEDGVSMLAAAYGPGGVRYGTPQPGMRFGNRSPGENNMTPQTFVRLFANAIRVAKDDLIFANRSFADTSYVNATSRAQQKAMFAKLRQGGSRTPSPPRYSPGFPDGSNSNVPPTRRPQPTPPKYSPGFPTPIDPPPTRRPDPTPPRISPGFPSGQGRQGIPPPNIHPDYEHTGQARPTTEYTPASLDQIDPARTRIVDGTFVNPPPPLPPSRSTDPRQPDDAASSRTPKPSPGSPEPVYVRNPMPPGAVISRGGDKWLLPGGGSIPVWSIANPDATPPPPNIVPVDPNQNAIPHIDELQGRGPFAPEIGQAENNKSQIPPATSVQPPADPAPQDTPQPRPPLEPVGEIEMGAAVDNYAGALDVFSAYRPANPQTVQPQFMQALPILDLFRQEPWQMGRDPDNMNRLIAVIDEFDRIDPSQYTADDAAVAPAFMLMKGMINSLGYDAFRPPEESRPGEDNLVERTKPQRPVKPITTPAVPDKPITTPGFPVPPKTRPTPGQPGTMPVPVKPVEPPSKRRKDNSAWQGETR